MIIDYKYSNLFLITEMQFPHGRTISDTLEYNMARPDGSWLGTGFGDVSKKINCGTARAFGSAKKVPIFFPSGRPCAAMGTCGSRCGP